MKKKGYFQIYTGNGKGKTTAAIGAAIRACGAGLKVYFGQFMKGVKYSEHNIFNRISNIDYETYGSKDFIIKKDIPDKKNIDLAELGLFKAKKSLISLKYDLVILDEINITPFFNLLTEDSIIDLIDLKPPQVDLIFTGRNASKNLLEKADLVTEMKEIKHYYNNGVEARLGFEL